jgi:2-polyprenyl-3-methyl-5-hydroxy-6-metoxy-1,4-benzoquinol methylase
VAVASYGEKNLPYLKQVIQSYRDMTFETDLVVISNLPKKLGDDVKVVVGLPSSNPWSLPFAHKPVFAENVERYDLFVYTEDDIEVTENQIRAFMRATAAMEPDEIPGYIRFEVGQNNIKLLTEAHAAFHWKPESVKRRGGYTIAEFTNEHAGFYIVTQSQLRRALASGEFLRAPYQGRYGLPETAATDIYTCCGFRKVICISALEDFLIRHMSNRYVSQLGVSLQMFQKQIQTLMRIRDGAHPVSALGAAEPKVLQRNFYKSFYEQPDEDILKMIPACAKQILSIGCGWGAMEVRLKEHGAEVTAVPLDSIFGAAAAHLGINVVYGTLAECLSHLQNRKFDAVVMTDLLHLLPNPEQVIEQCARLVGPGGTLVIGGPNFDRLPILIKCVLGKGDYRKLRSYDQSGINIIGPTHITKRLKGAGFSITTLQWLRHLPLRWRSLEIRARLGRLAAGNWLLQARKGLSH